MGTYYNILGLENFASPVEVKSAFKKLALLYHPDRNPDDKLAEEKFKLINEAYQILSNPEKKTHYDLILLYGRDAFSAPVADTRDPYYRNRDRRGARRTQGQAPQKVKPHFYLTNTQAVIFALLLISYMFMVHSTVMQLYSRIQYFYAIGEMENKNYKAALEHATRSAGVDENFVKAHTLKANLSLEHFNYNSEAVKHFSLAIEKSALFHVDLHLKRAFAYTNLNKEEEATQDFEIVLRHHPDSVKLLKKIGDIYFHTFRSYNRALKMYDELIARNMATGEIYFTKAVIFKHRQDMAQALENFSKSIDLQPTAQAFYERAQIKADQQQIAPACADWKQAKALKPGLTDVRLDFFCEEKKEGEETLK